MVPALLKAILFDKDGTLIDFDATWGPAAYEVMRTLAQDDPGKLQALMAVSHYVEAERRFRPTSPLLAGSSASYGPLWAQTLGRASGPDLYGEMDDLFRFWCRETLAPIGEPVAIAAALKARGLKLGVATNDAECSARAQATALGLDAYLDFVAGYDQRDSFSGVGAWRFDHVRLADDHPALCARVLVSVLLGFQRQLPQECPCLSDPVQNRRLGR